MSCPAEPARLVPDGSGDEADRLYREALAHQARLAERRPDRAREQD